MLESAARVDVDVSPASPAALTRDPVLRGLLGLGVAIAAWYATGWGGLGAQVLVFWLVQIPLGFGLSVLSWRVVRLPGLPKPARRFWAAASIAGLVYTVGDIAQTFLILPRPAAADATPKAIETACFVVGTCFPMWVMLTLPTPTGSRREQVRFWLDAGTVMVAAAVYAWYFAFDPGSVRGDATGPVRLLVTAGIQLVGAFAIVKLLLTGAAGFVRSAAVASAVGLLAMFLTDAITPVLLDSPHLNLLLAARLIPGVVVIAAPRLQELRLRGDPELIARRRRRPYSVLPYAAIAATLALLMVVLSRGEQGTRVWGVLIGLVVITVLVVTRQLAAFADNARLLSRLDASMLELRHHEQRLRSLVQHASDITVITVDGRITYASPALERVLGIAPEQAIGRPGASAVHPDDLADLRDVFAALAATPRASATFQVRARHADGSWRWLEVISTNLQDEPAVNGIVSNARDVTETREHQDLLRHQALHDPLTQLANRSLFSERIRTALPGSQPDRLAILLIDLDDFKAVNDTLGHQVGDALLVAVADRLRACVRPHDTVARLGGDEFAVVLPGADESDASAIADRIRAALTKPVRAEGHDLLARASIGLAAGAAGDPDSLIRTADAAMYAAKRRSKDASPRY